VIAIDQDPWAIRNALKLKQDHPNGYVFYKRIAKHTWINLDFLAIRHNLFPRLGKLSQVHDIVTKELNLRYRVQEAFFEQH
jgi:heme oxygenase